jgi:hypothetical protein
MLNTRKNDDLIKYENSLNDKIKNGYDKSSDMGINENLNNLNNTGIDNNPSSPRTNFNNVENVEVSAKIKDNMINISKMLSEKLKENAKLISTRYVEKEEAEKISPHERLIEIIETAKKLLNKK